MTARRTPMLHAVSTIVLVIGLVITALLSFGAWTVRDSNEDRLLRQRAHEAGTIAATAVSSLLIPLTSTAGLAETTNGDPDSFVKLMGPITLSRRLFASASLWRLDRTVPIADTGGPLELTERPPDAVQQVLARAAAAKGTLVVEDLLGPPQRRLGYAVAAPVPNPRYVVYAEAALPRTRQAQIASNTGFDDLDYALYLGRKSDPHRLLASSTGHGLAADVRTAADTVPFGDTALRIVISPQKDLGGPLLARLPWLLAVAGVVLTLGATMLVEWVERQRDRAERLAGELEVAAAENQQLYAEQRRIASTLQQSLLPRDLPQLPAIETAARYEAGVEGTEVGGDWYDVIPLRGGRAFFSVGDVVGRGIDAATTMAALRFSIRAHALEEVGPAWVLDRLGVQSEAWPSDHFATVVCAVLDPARHEITVARAGHPDLLVVEGTDVRFLDAPLGPPIGVEPSQPYREATVALAPEGMVLGYTDGLIERRGEHLQVGLDRLARSAAAHAGSVDALVAGTVADLAHDESADDVAVLALRWHAVPAPAPDADGDGTTVGTTTGTSAGTA